MATWDPLLVELLKAAVVDPARARQIVVQDPRVLDFRTGLGETALHYLAVENYAAAVELLIELGASVHVVNKFGSSPLAEAQLVGATETVEVLERAGATARMRED
jgi:hypothetical protein